MSRALQSRNGIMLLSVLWVLAILSLLALMLSRLVTVEQSFLNYSMGRMHSSAAARAGTAYALTIAQHPEASKNKDVEQLFKHYPVSDFAYVDIVGGITNEESKINLNALSEAVSWQAFVNMLTQADIPKDQAEAIAAAVIDWKDDDEQGHNKAFIHPDSATVIGAENEYYQSLEIPYKAKNRAFDSIEELLMVKGMTPAIYGKIKKFITVFPKVPVSGFQIDLASASREVLQAYLKAYAQRAPDLVPDAAKAENTVEAYRQVSNKEDPGNPVVQEFESLKGRVNALSQGQYLHIRSQGVDKQRGVKVIIESVWHKDDSIGQMILKAWQKR